MNDLTIMITAAGNQYMLGLVKCFRENGERNIRLVGTDMSNDSTILQMMDINYKVPAASDPLYADKLLEVCKKEKAKGLVCRLGLCLRRSRLHGCRRHSTRTYSRDMAWISIIITRRESQRGGI